MTIKKVAIVIYEGVQALDVAGPADVFAEASRILQGACRYQVQVIAASREPVRASSGMLLSADMDFAMANGESFDILLVAGSPDLLRMHQDGLLTDWVREAAPRTGIYGAICTGAFVLGHAGLLDGRRVTTHWQHSRQLAREFPLARVEADAIHVQDGPLVTSAGVTAGIDLALALVSQEHGAELATEVAKQLVVVVQRMGGQSQFSPFLAVPQDSSSAVSQIQMLVMENLGAQHSLHSLAEAVGMSPRSLSRHFQREAGITPHEFVQRARIDAARKLLEASSKPLKTIAFECGFGSSDRMRLVFSERLGITPAQYRASFQHQAGNA